MTSGLVTQETLLALASNPASPTEVLDSLCLAAVGGGAVIGLSVGSALARNPNIPLKWVPQLLLKYPAEMAVNPVLCLLFLEDPAVLMNLLSSVAWANQGITKYPIFVKHPSLASALLGEASRTLTFTQLRKRMRDARTDAAETLFVQWPSTVEFFGFGVCRWERPGFGKDKQFYALATILKGLSASIRTNAWANDADLPLLNSLADLEELADIQ
jgi:hypothetical protein